MATTTLTAAQIERIAGMNEADAKCWTAWYLEQNEAAEAEQRAAERAIVAALGAGIDEPTAIRRAAGVPAVAFNGAVRFLKLAGSLAIDEAGLFYSAF